MIFPDKSAKSRLVLGIDPGSHSTGYGLIEQIGSQLRALCFGCIRPKTTTPTSDTPTCHTLGMRYRTIYEEIIALIERYRPWAIAVETQFVQKNAASALKIGMVRGVVHLAAALHEIPLFEYAPAKAKLVVTGTGRASKEQVIAMVKQQLALGNISLAEDAADALAIAICHALQAGRPLLRAIKR